MNGFIRINLVAWGLLLVVFVEIETASGQIAPRRSFRGGNGGYDGYDAVIYPDINQSNAALQQAYTQQREYQAQTSMARTNAWRSVNQSMAQQADDRTQTMMAQRQSGKDWWYSIEEQKMAQSQARAASRPRYLPGAEYAEPVTPAAQASQPQKEIMLWPTLLKEDEFDGLRAKVEAPFRRAYADNKPLTADDYRGILQAIGELKAKVKAMSSQVLESEYAAVNGYLDELAADSQKRLDARLAPQPTEEKKEAAGEKAS